jgi:hypothetical protein
MERLFEGFLVINWKTGHMVVKKRKPKNINPYQIPVKFEITVKVPEQKEVVAKGNIELTDQQATAIVVEEI